jgi:hypothetical protein
VVWEMALHIVFKTVQAQLEIWKQQRVKELVLKICGRF